MSKLKDILTVADAAESLGVNPMTLRRWDKARKLVAKRHPINNYRLYSREQIEKILAKILVT